MTKCSFCKAPLHSTTQGPDHCSTLHFGLGPSDPVQGISGSELEVDVEYTFRLTVSKEGMTPESTTQTVRALIVDYNLFVTTVFEFANSLKKIHLTLEKTCITPHSPV